MTKVVFRVTAVLWAVWGPLHFLVAFPYVLGLGRAEGLPATVQVAMFGGEIPLHVRQTLLEGGFNNGWFGLVVTIGSILVWKGRRDAVYLCSIVGGLAHLSFTIFLVLPGYTDPVGVAMTVVAAAAVVLGLLGARNSTGSIS